MSELNQAILLYFDAATNSVRAAAVPHGIDIDATSLHFRGVRIVNTGNGVIFWDYLVRPNNDIVGVVLNDFELDEPLARSQLLTNANNVTRNTLGYEVLLADAPDAENDSSQAFGAALFQNDENCFLFLTDFHQRGYAFPVDSGLISSLS